MRNDYLSRQIDYLNVTEVPILYDLKNYISKTDNRVFHKLDEIVNNVSIGIRGFTT